MGWASGFLAGQSMARGAIDAYRQSKWAAEQDARKKEMAAISTAQVEPARRFDPEAAQELGRQVATGQYNPVYDEASGRYALVPKDGAAVGPVQEIAPRTQFNFLGKSYDKPLDEATQNRGRMLAQAGVLEKYGDTEGGMRMRNEVRRTEREDALWPLQKEAAELNIGAARRTEDEAKRLSKVEADFGAWARSQDGPVDDFAAAQHRARLLAQEGFGDKANEVVARYYGMAANRINVQTAERDAAAPLAAQGLARGDPSAAIAFWNKYIPSGDRVTGFTRTKDGKFVFHRVTDDGVKMPDGPPQSALELTAALGELRTPGAILNYSHQQFMQNMARNQDQRAAASASRAAANEAQSKADKADTIRAAVSLYREQNPGATPAQIEAVRRGILPAVPGKGAQYKVESGDVMSLLAEPVLNARGEPIVDPISRKPLTQTDPRRAQDFFVFMDAAGIRDTNEGLLKYKSMPEFASEAEVDAALKSGQLKPGSFVRVGGVTGRAQLRKRSAPAQTPGRVSSGVVQ